MSIIATIPVFLLSNSIALNKLLEQDYTQSRGFSQSLDSEWGSWAGAASLFRDSSRPGHVFDKRWELYQATPGLGLLPAFNCMADEYLCVVNRRLYIKSQEKFARWQNIRSRMTTLPVKCFMLYRSGLPLVNELVHPQSPSMADYISREGVNETHLHLFACELPETAWLHDLANLTKFHIQEEKNYAQHRRLYVGVHPDLTPLRLTNRMKLARVLRTNLLHVDREQDAAEAIVRMRDAYRKLVLFPDCYTPQEEIYGESSAELMSLEAEMNLWSRVFSWEREGYALLDGLLFYAHMYLLIQNEYMHLKRQQENRMGFDAFDRVSRHRTVERPMLQYLEDSFARIISSTEATEKTMIEVRVTPWVFYNKGQTVLTAWNKNLSRCMRGTPRLILVVHFIKNKGENTAPGKDISLADKYASARLELMIQAKRVADYSRHIGLRYRVPIGIDAAGNELLMPAEVLAPVFRQFERDSQIGYKTYHCGEEFYHLIGGMRAVYDALIFLDMKNGNRLGHATAIGIKPEVWMRCMPDVIVQRNGDWLLDLIFAWKMLHPIKLEQAAMLEHMILSLAQEIFDSAGNLSMQTLLAFYDARQLIPDKVKFMLEKTERPTWSCNEEDQLIIDFIKERGVCGLRLLCHWHYDADSRHAQEKNKELPLNILDKDVLLLMQQQVQRIVNARNVIIETLPVSNVRISQYQDMQEHHLLRWLRVEGHACEGDEEMTICVGSDDPGIFVTDLKNEYYHIFSNLMLAGQSPAQSIEIVRRLNDAGRIYAFRQIHPLPHEACLSENMEGPRNTDEYTSV